MVNNPCWLATLARAVRKTNQSYYSNQNVTPRHIQKLVTLVVREEGETRRSRLLCLAVFLSFTKKANCERSGLGG